MATTRNIHLRRRRPQSGTDSSAASSLSTRCLLAAALAVCLLLAFVALPALAQSATGSDGGAPTTPVGSGADAGGDNGQTIGGGEAPTPAPTPTPTPTPNPTPTPTPGGGNGGVGGGGGGGGGSNPPTASNPDRIGGPTSDGAAFPVWAIIVVSAAGGLLLIFFVIKVQNPRATHFDVIIFFVAIFDFASDVWLIISLKDNVDFPVVSKLAIVFTAVPFLLNFGALMYIFRQEIHRNLAFRRWLQYNFAPFTAVFLTSCTSTDAMFVLDSHVCELPCLKAPWSEHMTTLLRMVGFVTILFEDIPQACLQIYIIATSNFQLVNIITLCLSLSMITFGVTKRVLVCCVYHIEQGDVEAQKEYQAKKMAPRTERAVVKAVSRHGHNVAAVGKQPEQVIQLAAVGTPTVAATTASGLGHTKPHEGVSFAKESQQAHPNTALPPREVYEVNTAILPASTVPTGAVASYAGQPHLLRSAGEMSGKGLEYSTSHVKYHPGGSGANSLANTPESRYRSIGGGGAGSGAVVSSAAVNVAMRRPSAPSVEPPAEASASKGTRMSPFTAPPAGRTPSPVTPPIAETQPGLTQVAAAAGAPGFQPPRQHPSGMPHRRSSLDGTEGVGMPPLPPRPSSANSSPVIPPRTLNNPSQSGHSSGSSTSQQVARSVPHGHPQSAALPPIPTRPLASSAHPPAFTINAADSRTDLEFISQHSHVTYQPQAGGKTLADLNRT